MWEHKINPVKQEEGEMVWYILDHIYVKDHDDFRRVTAGCRETREVHEILTAIQFWWEENVDEHSNPDLDQVIAVLEKHFGFEAVDKDDMRNIIRFVYDEEGETGETEQVINGIRYVLIDLYSMREMLCGLGQPEKLFEKWLDDEIKADIEKIEPDKRWGE